MSISEELREKIFQEVKRLKLEESSVWASQKWNMYKYNLEPPFRDLFLRTMRDLCAEGYFEEEPEGTTSRYRLTKKGYALIYSLGDENYHA